MNVSKAPKYDPLNAGTLWSDCGEECGKNYNNNLNQLGIELEFSETANRDNYIQFMTQLFELIY